MFKATPTTPTAPTAPTAPATPTAPTAPAAPAAPAARTMPAVLTLAAFAASSAMGQFYSVGVAGPGGTSQVVGLSYDGRIAAGNTRVSGDNRGFLWTAEGGRDDIGRRPGSPRYNPISALSGDGRFVAGARSQDTVSWEAFRWSESGGYETIGVPSGWDSVHSAALNGDGSVIVGYLSDESGFFYQPFRWTASGGMQLMRNNGNLINAVASAVSSDGSTVVGSVTSGGAYKWTVDAGYRALPRASMSNWSPSAFGVSRDGTLVVGESGGIGVGVLWTETEAILLGTLSERQRFLASEVSDDGLTVAGTSTSNLMPEVATVWTASFGVQTLADYLVANGITLPMNVVLSTCEAMSADGKTFAGTARIANQSNSSFGYVVTIPTPAISACIFAGILVSCRRKRG